MSAELAVSARSSANASLRVTGHPLGRRNRGARDSIGARLALAKAGCPRCRPGSRALPRSRRSSTRGRSEERSQSAGAGEAGQPPTGARRGSRGRRSRSRRQTGGRPFRYRRRPCARGSRAWSPSPRRDAPRRQSGPDREAARRLATPQRPRPVQRLPPDRDPEGRLPRCGVRASELALSAPRSPVVRPDDDPRSASAGHRPYLHSVSRRSEPCSHAARPTSNRGGRERTPVPIVPL
jgi:hypothetical protein